jgi:hypothetical protein
MRGPMTPATPYAVNSMVSLRPAFFVPQKSAAVEAFTESCVTNCTFQELTLIKPPV